MLIGLEKVFNLLPDRIASFHNLPQNSGTDLAFALFTNSVFYVIVQTRVSVLPLISKYRQAG